MEFVCVNVLLEKKGVMVFANLAKVERSKTLLDRHAYNVQAYDLYLQSAALMNVNALVLSGR
jgi:hypothetical protein